MRRAEKTNSNGLTIVIGVLAVLSIALLGWRELSHGSARQSLHVEMDELSVQLATTQSRKAVLTGDLTEANKAIEEAEISLQSMQDRAGNLEAQRDHLRAQVDQRSERIRELESNADAIQAELNRTRLSLLDAQQLPASLQSRLAASSERIEQLENQLDGYAAQRSEMPDLLSWEGSSSDEAVFAISGTLPDSYELPASVYLCDVNGLILDGWLARIEGNMLLGHVEHWRSPVSALVKGEKVFILPRKGHEEDF
ncbi:MAG: hypothetical protein AB3N63_16265 [Puniceicoccaceae bacterium]